MTETGRGSCSVRTIDICFPLNGLDCFGALMEFQMFHDKLQYLLIGERLSTRKIVKT